MPTPLHRLLSVPLTAATLGGCALRPAVTATRPTPPPKWTMAPAAPATQGFVSPVTLAVQDERGVYVPSTPAERAARREEQDDRRPLYKDWRAYAIGGAVVGVGVGVGLALAGSDDDSNSRDDGGGNGGLGGAGSDPGPIGDVTFTLLWDYAGDAPGPDVDLFVTDPLGQTLSTSREGFALGPTPEGGEIDRDEDGAGDTVIGDDGGGPERAFWPTGQAPVGVYTFGVIYTEGFASPVPEVRYTLIVYADGSQVTQFVGALTAEGERVTVGTLEYQRDDP